MYCVPFKWFHIHQDRFSRSLPGKCCAVVIFYYFFLKSDLGCPISYCHRNSRDTAEMCCSSRLISSPICVWLCGQLLDTCLAFCSSLQSPLWAERAPWHYISDVQTAGRVKSKQLVGSDVYLRSQDCISFYFFIFLFLSGRKVRAMFRRVLGWVCRER